MKRSLLIPIFVSLFTFGQYGSWAQCSLGTATLSCCQFSSFTTSFQTISFQHNVYKTFSAVAGTTYTFSFCSGDGGSTIYDTEITILDDFGIPVDATGVTGYDDDGCGTTASLLVWTAPLTATYWVTATEFPCTSTTNVSTMVYKMSGGLSLATEPIAQPTNLVFSSVTTTSFTLSFTPASGFPDGYLGVANNSGSSPTFAPVDGATYTNGQNVGSGSDFISFSGSSTTLNVTGAALGTTLQYAIYSFNGSGTTTNYFTSFFPLSGSVTTLASTDVNVPSVSVSAPTTTIQQDITINVNATDASGVTGVYVDYGKVEDVEDVYDFGSDPNVFSVELFNSGGDDYTGTIPASAIGEMGVVFVVYAYDPFDNEYVDDFPRVITLSKDGSGISIPYTNPGTGQSNYKVVSVPLSLEKKTVNDVFGDDLGLYGDKSVWRMFRYQSGSNIELAGTSSIDAGRGYWLISSRSASIDSGPGTTFNGSYENPATLTLSTGWNQIGNPYTFNLLWQDIVDWNDPLVLGDLKTFGGSSFSNASVLKSTEGGFVFSQGGGTIDFPLYRNPSAGRVGESKPNTNPIDSDDWEVLFNIKNGELINEMGGIGMNKGAALLNDRFDDFTLPRFFDYLEINHHKRFVDIPISRDVIPVQDNYAWEFDIESSTSDNIIEMTWDNSYFGQNEKQLILWDESQQRAIDMRKTSFYQFDKTLSKEFKVYYGNEAYVKEVVSTNGIVFHEIFPNPVKDKVTFAFSLPNAGADHNITLEVYDLIGRKVGAVIEGNYSPGYHEVLWHIEGQEATPNGMYLVKLKEGLVAKTKKFIIKQ